MRTCIRCFLSLFLFNAMVLAQPESVPALQPVPTPAKRAEAEKLVRDLFSREYAKAALTDRLALAQLLQEKAKEANDDMAVKFTMLWESYRLALEAAEARTVCTALDQLSASFAIPTQTELNNAVARLETQARTPEQFHSLAEASLSLANQWVQSDQYDQALRELSRTQRLAHHAHDSSLENEARNRGTAVQELIRDFAPFRPAFTKLQTDPKDQEANASAGLFYCLLKQNWKQGLPMLERSPTPELNGLAKAELATTTTPDQQVTVGNLWWDWGQTQPPKYKRLAWARAAYWYNNALATLTGVAKMRVEKRLKEYTDLCTAAGPNQGGGLIEAGNVALARNGATARAEGNAKSSELGPKFLIDGITKGYDGSHLHTAAKWPASWIVTLPKTYRLSEIRVLLWDGDDRYQRYAIETSADGNSFTPLVDHSKGQWRSWQIIDFPPRLVSAIRLRGLFGSVNEWFGVVEVEAYCIPPAERPQPRFPSEPK